LGQGRDNARQYLKENAELGEEIAAKVMANREQLLAMARAVPKRYPALLPQLQIG
jgi:hypothetical protein